MKRNMQFGVVVTSTLMVTLVGVNVMASNHNMFITEGGYPVARTSIEKKLNKKEDTPKAVEKEETLEEEKTTGDFDNGLFYTTSFVDSNEVVSQEQDANILNLYTEQKEEEARIKRIEEMYKRTAWLKEYNIDPTGLNEERLNTLAEAKKYIGTPYVYGGTTPRGFDCSGYTRWVFKQVFGVDISRTTSTQPRSKYLKEIPISEAKPGDLFYKIGQHTGFFLKDLGNKILILHSPRPGKRLEITTYSKNVRMFRPVMYND